MTTSSRPLLSVVIPVYNVEEYLGQCLDSILAQDFPGLEVVVVDDGSTDASAGVAQGYARQFDNIVVLKSGHRGIGAARNVGVRASSGHYLTFADADDIVPAGAYTLMVSTLERSGSDFVVGSVRQLVNERLRVPPFLRSVHAEPKIGITVEDLPDVLRNVFPWNKTFRRSFWERNGLSFPEGVRYEDQVAMTTAYLQARRFDVVQRPVYTWRRRADSTSITQQRSEVADLRDRLTTKQMTSDVVAALGSPEIQEHWTRHGLGGDFPLYFRHIPGCSDEYWDLLVSGLRGLYAGHQPISRSCLLRVQQRLLGWLVSHDRRRQAESVQRWLLAHPGPLSLRPRHGYVVAELPFLDDPGADIPPELFRLADHEQCFDARMMLARGEGEHLEVTGWALIRGVPTTGVPCTIRAWLRADTGDQVDLDVQRRPSPEATVWLKRLPQRYDDCGFTVSIDLAWLREVPHALETVWTLEFDVVAAGIRRRGPIRTAAADAFADPAAGGAPTYALAFRPGTGLQIAMAGSDRFLSGQHRQMVGESSPDGSDVAVGDV